MNSRTFFSAIELTSFTGQPSRLDRPLDGDDETLEGGVLRTQARKRKALATNAGDNAPTGDRIEGVVGELVRCALGEPRLDLFGADVVAGALGDARELGECPFLVFDSHCAHLGLKR